MDWERAWSERRTPWDLGQVTPPLARFLAGDGPAELGIAADARVVVPGCGRGHDVRAWARSGRRTTGLDVVPAAVREARELLRWNGVGPERAEVLVRDLLGLGPDLAAAFDVVYDHTCFCALAPHLRAAYGAAMRHLLRPGGLWLGLVFPMAPGGYVDRPPYRIEPGDIERALGPSFEVVSRFDADDSVPERAGYEAWLALRFAPREAGGPQS